MAEDMKLTWSLPITLGKLPNGKWDADSPYLNYMGDGKTPREALTNLFTRNSDGEGGTLFFSYQDGMGGMTLEQVVNSLLPNDDEVVKGPGRCEASLPEPPFKVGDKVRDKEAFRLLEGTVRQVYTSGNLSVQIDKHSDPMVVGIDVFRFHNEVELVPKEPPTPEPTFKVGDTVRCKSCQKDGMLAWTKTSDSGTPLWRFAGEEMSTDYPHPESCLEHVETTTEAEPTPLVVVKKEPNPPFRIGDWAVCTDCGHVGRLDSVEEDEVAGYLWEFRDDEEQHAEYNLLRLNPEWYKRLAS